MDITSGSLGATADLIDTGTSGFSLFESITSIVRGGQRRKGHASRAAKKMGKKEQTKGAWGAVGSSFGLLGSLANLGGNISKIVGGGQEKHQKDSGQAAGAASGVLGLIGGTLGTIGGGVGLVEGVKSAIRGGVRRIQASSKDYTKPTSTNPNDVKLRNIANFTAKNQKIWGSIMSSVNSTLTAGGGISGMVGGIAQLAGDNTTGFVADIVGATASLFGMAGGLAQTAIEHADSPKDQDLTDRSNDLIELLRLGDPDGKNAAKFALKVLNINFIDLVNDVTWTDWIEEDEGSARDLIKSKISKH
jgi:hypothetical protein